MNQLIQNHKAFIITAASILALAGGATAIAMSAQQPLSRSADATTQPVTAEPIEQVAVPAVETPAASAPVDSTEATTPVETTTSEPAPAAPAPQPVPQPSEQPAPVQQPQEPAPAYQASERTFSGTLTTDSQETETTPIVGGPIEMIWSH